jgi:hypothetical protein
MLNVMLVLGQIVSFVAVKRRVLSTIKTVVDVECWHPPFTTVNFTIYLPVAAYTCEGYSRVEVVPSPNSHRNDKGAFDLSKMDVLSNDLQYGLPQLIISLNRAIGGNIRT